MFHRRFQAVFRVLSVLYRLADVQHAKDIAPGRDGTANLTKCLLCLNIATVVFVSAMV